MELSQKWCLRDKVVVFISVLWVIASMIPVNFCNSDLRIILGIERDLGYFIYELTIKFGVIWAFSLAILKGESVVIPIVIKGLLGDAIYEFLDLIVTNDNGPFFGLLLQNLFIMTGVGYGIYKQQKKTVNG